MLFSQKWMNCGGGFIRTSYYNEFIKILCLSNNANIQTLNLKTKFIEEKALILLIYIKI
jgi:hypothetical protein